MRFSLVRGRWGWRENAFIPPKTPTSRREQIAARAVIWSGEPVERS
jgi:hypothetical protein